MLTDYRSGAALRARLVRLMSKSATKAAVKYLQRRTSPIIPRFSFWRVGLSRPFVADLDTNEIKDGWSGASVRR